MGERNRGVAMHIISLVWGILAIIAALAFLLPFIGWLNWINIFLFSGPGLLISVITAVLTKDRTKKVYATIGAFLCSIAILIGVLRLFMGLGMI